MRTEGGGRLCGHQRDRVLWFMLGAGSVVLALALLTILVRGEKR
jgi:hypothetical protein